MLHVRVVAADGHAAATVTVPSATSATRVLLTSAVLAFRPPPATPTTAAEATRRMKRTMPLEDAGDSDEGSDDSSSSDDTGAAGGGGGDDAVREASDADTEAELDPYVALGHRMFKEGRLLDTHRTVQENGLRDGDVVVVVPVRHIPPLTPFDRADSRVRWSEGDVDKATAAYPHHARESLPKQTVPALANHVEYRAQLRDLIRTLSTMRGRGGNPDDGAASAVAQGVATEGALPPSRPGPVGEVDPDALKTLTDMGYAETAARNALLRNRMSPIVALEWLLAHVNDPDLDVPLSSEQLARIADRHARNPFRADPAALRFLTDMGFNRFDVIEALRVTHNDQNAACAWILGDRDVAGLQLDADEDPEVAETSTEHPVIRSILANTRVVSGMTDPRVNRRTPPKGHVAFGPVLGDLLENPGRISEYVNDPEAGPVITEIWTIIQREAGR